MIALFREFSDSVTLHVLGITARHKEIDPGGTASYHITDKRHMSFTTLVVLQKVRVLALDAEGPSYEPFQASLEVAPCGAKLSASHFAP